MTKIMLELPVGNTNITDLFDFSPALVEDLKQILASERYQGGKGHNVRSMSARFRVVLTACRFIIANDADAELLKQGFSGFVKEHYAPVKSIYSSEIRKELRNVQHELDKDIEALGMRLKVLNIVILPLLFTLLLWGVVVWRRRRQSL